MGSGFPNWMPPMSGTEQQHGGDKDGKNGSGGSHSRVNGAAATPVRVGGKSRDRVVGASGGRARGVVGNTTGMPGPRKRGRPRKYPVVS